MTKSKLTNKTESDFSQRMKIVELYEFYSSLFTKKQQDYFLDSYYNDNSLTEIAEKNQVSKAAVHDSLTRIIADLDYYEDKLHLREKYHKRLKLLEKINDDSLKKEFLKLENVEC